MSRTLRFTLACFVILLAASVARAETILAEFQFTGTVRNPAADVPIRPFMSYGDPAIQPAVGFIETDAMGFFDFLSGTRHDLTGDFGAFATLASNGVNQTIYVGFEVDGAGSASDGQAESTLLGSASFLLPGLGNPDFAGYEVTRVDVLGTSYAPLEGDRLELSFQYAVYGNVPEPGSWALLALGACALVGYGRARHRRS